MNNKSIKEIYRYIQDCIFKIKQDSSFHIPISKIEYKKKKSICITIKKNEKELNTSHNSANINKENYNSSLLVGKEKEKEKDYSVEITNYKFRYNYDYIRKDISRTIHEKEFKEINGEEKLSRILEALSFSIDDIGYVQGMNFIAGALLVLTNSEEESFFIFYILLKRYDMIHLYKKVLIKNTLKFLKYKVHAGFLFKNIPNK